MTELILKILDFYFEKRLSPTVEDLWITDPSLLEQPGSVFVTLYKKGEVIGSAGNIKEIEWNLAEELISSTLDALNDKRFETITKTDLKNLKVRADVITERKILAKTEITSLDPVKAWVIAIKKDYSDLAVILPNVSPQLITGEDFYEALKFKLNEKKFEEKDHILYGIETRTENNF